jgi:uncharacterized membrane protein
MSQAGDGTDRVGGLRVFVRQALVTGTAVVVPILLTVVVLFVGFDVLSSLLAPIAIPLDRGLGGPGEAALVANALAALVLVSIILVVGLLVESDYGGDRIEAAIDRSMSRIPGIGSIYGTLDQVSEMLLESDTDSFQEVVLVEYPAEGSYSVAFKTADPPAAVRESVGDDDMTTVFMPMGPNPVMGGFVLHIATDRVHDVDLSVEEGISSIVSFGVAIDADREAGSGAVGA